MSCKRGYFAGDAFHHATIAAQRIHVEIEQIEAGAIVTSREPLAGDGHAHAGSGSLTERSGSCLDARGPAVFRMARTSAVQLPKGLDRIQRYGDFAKRLVVFADRSNSRQMQQ